ncbi:hypothetical protein CC1G_11005 [Coprinopsis cinerea okayama7|uniref:G-protein coupled receptors family 1 profile domain-containing protein n=1 Tax=Coprinopsis cinerea (strain Okayama-7 / 130 / ATCC MYA-4618 / FGSC 9003) TaxID=240176 RepID=A8P735_COPC7|nr:hypothetical protein CC1G_11005 [Coprinopsis cinerea okayama7\|eukprot:XP_001839283.1 hypothetical protein CC1G_11005 [Coprinopsis cinerea okayama7\
MSAQTVQMWLSMITLWAMQGIIINRLWCMYRYSKTILILLLVTFTIQVAAGITIQSLNKTINIVVPLLPGLDSCIPTGFLPWFWAVLLFIMTFDLLIVILAILEGIRFYRRSAHSRHLRNKARGPLSAVLAPWLAEGSIVRVLLRDSILFPFIGLAVCFFAMLSWLEVLPWGSVQVTMVLNALTAPVLGSRLILNLRDAYYQPFAEEAGGKEGPSRYTGATSTTGKLRTVEFPMSYTSTATKTGHISYGTNETVNT